MIGMFSYLENVKRLELAEQCERDAIKRGDHDEAADARTFIRELQVWFRDLERTES